MQKVDAGHREVEHTADWALEVWAPDLSALLEQAARGMYDLVGARLQPEPRLTREFHLEADDAEDLLVAFLSELLFLGEHEGVGFDTFALNLDGYNLNACVDGAPFAARRKEIKAVTYHNLEIQSGSRGLVVQIVFDV